MLGVVAQISGDILPRLLVSAFRLRSTQSSIPPVLRNLIALPHCIQSPYALPRKERPQCPRNRFNSLSLAFAAFPDVSIEGFDGLVSRTTPPAPILIRCMVGAEITFGVVRPSVGNHLVHAGPTEMVTFGGTTGTRGLGKIRDRLNASEHHGWS